MSKSDLEFRKIPSLKFLYEISEDGRIVRNVKSKHQIKIVLDKHHSKSGYYAFWTYCLLDGVRKVRRHMVHHIIAECWHGQKPEGYEVDHIDRNSHNNHYTNIRYVTKSQQMKNRVLGSHVIAQATKNCQEWNKKISIGVKAIKEGVQHTFDSIGAASRWMGDFYNLPSEHIRAKMKKRRSHIYDFDVFYLNAETAYRKPHEARNSPVCIS